MLGFLKAGFSYTGEIQKWYAMLGSFSPWRVVHLEAWVSLNIGLSYRKATFGYGVFGGASGLSDSQGYMYCSLAYMGSCTEILHIWGPCFRGARFKDSIVSGGALVLECVQ